MRYVQLLTNSTATVHLLPERNRCGHNAEWELRRLPESFYAGVVPLALREFAGALTSCVRGSHRCHCSNDGTYGTDGAPLDGFVSSEGGATATAARRLMRQTSNSTPAARTTSTTSKMTPNAQGDRQKLPAVGSG